MARKLTNVETTAWLDSHAQDRRVSEYLDSATRGVSGWSTSPAHGIVIRYAGVEFLVWVDASGTIHVLDVTGDPIADEVNKPAYESPDAGLLDVLTERLNALTSGLPSGRETLVLLLVAGVLAAVLVYGGRR